MMKRIWVSGCTLDGMVVMTLYIIYPYDFISLYESSNIATASA